MAKRRAEKYLTMENFDDDDDRDDDPNDSSDTNVMSIKSATDDVLKSRVMAKARRSETTISDTNDANNKKLPFSGFKGFDTKSLGSLSLSKSGFSNQFESFVSKTQTNTSITATTVPSNGTTNTTATTTITTSDDITENISEEREEEYDSKLAELNRSFLEHLNRYMDQSRYYDFSQVCKEYIDFHAKIDSERLKQTNDGSSKTQPTIVSASQNSASTLEFSSQNSYATGTPSPVSSQSSAVISSQPQNVCADESKFAVPSNNLFSLNKFTSKANSMPTSNFFAAATKTSSVTTGDDATNSSVDTPVTVGDDDVHVPPKVEDVVHHEDDSIFSKKCKLYFKKGSEYKDKGVGMLFIKKNNNTNKCQLLIRANTRLGNVLLNISLAESLPIAKSDNNKGVLLTCIPNPPLDSRAKSDEQTTVTFLIRVKTTSDTDELYDNLIKYKSV